MAYEAFPSYPSMADALEAAERITVRWSHDNVRHLSDDQVAAIVKALRATVSETGETKACYGKPVAWIREWDGDDSDLGNFVVEWGTEAPADNHEWEPLYAESEGLHECMR